MICRTVHLKLYNFVNQYYSNKFNNKLKIKKNPSLPKKLSVNNSDLSKHLLHRHNQYKMLNFHISETQDHPYLVLECKVVQKTKLSNFKIAQFPGLTNMHGPFIQSGYAGTSTAHTASVPPSAEQLL